MTLVRVLALLLAGAPAVTGCVAAAALPVLAAGGIAGKKLHKRQSAPDPQVALVPQTAPSPAAPAAVPATRTPQAPQAPQAPVPPAAPPGMQYLYGSGEAAALSLQAYQALWRYLGDRAGDRLEGREIAAVVLAPGSTLAAPRFESCGKKPLAAVFDIDETVLLNLGYERDEAARGTGYDDARWKRWEATGADQVQAVPGAAEALEAARRAGITIVFNSNRSFATADATVTALDHAGLGKAELGKTLWLRAEGATSGKDSRRAEIAAKYCVVALVGDQLGDFSDLFNAPALGVPVRRNSASETMIAPLWGSGWFMLPNPVYGTGLKGGLDDVFPAGKAWTDPADAAPEAPAPAPVPEGVK